MSRERAGRKVGDDNEKRVSLSYDRRAAFAHMRRLCAVRTGKGE